MIIKQYIALSVFLAPIEITSLSRFQRHGLSGKMACVIASGTSCLMKFVSYLSEFWTGFGLFHTDLDTVGSGIKPVGYIYIL